MEGPRRALLGERALAEVAARWLSGRGACLGTSRSAPPAGVCLAAALRGSSKAKAGWHRGGS